MTTPDDGSAEAVGNEDDDLEFLTALETRLRDLEDDRRKLQSRSRLQTLGLFASLAGLAVLGYGMYSGGGLGGDSAAGALDASRLTIRDADGLARADLYVDEDGSVRFALSDRSSTQRLRFSVRPDGSPGLALQDAAGNNRVVLALLPDETGNLVFADKQAATRAVFGLSSDQRANLVFSDPAGTPLVALGVDGEGQSSLMLPSFELDPEPGSGGSP